MAVPVIKKSNHIRYSYCSISISHQERNSNLRSAPAASGCKLNLLIRKVITVNVSSTRSALSCSLQVPEDSF